MKRFGIFCVMLAACLLFCAFPASAKAEIVYRHVGNSEKKRVALTFDDGPGQYTEELLDFGGIRR